jgi:hypothetical protein
MGSPFGGFLPYKENTMAFTFTLVKRVPSIGIALYNVTTDTNSAASTLNPGFTPVEAVLFDETNANEYSWYATMPDASYQKVTSTTQSFETTNGFTPIETTAQQGITLGTGLHTNSSTYSLVLRG